MFKLLLFLVAVVGLWTLGPRIFKAGPRDWRHWLTALRHYVNIVAVVLIVVSGLGLAYAAAEYFRAR